jgi:hypothetical protein
MSFGGTDLQKALDDVNAQELFKVDFLEYYENTFNTASPFWERVKKPKTFVGKRLEFPAPLGFMGAAGSGKIPETRPAKYATVNITSKKMYAKGLIEREALGEASDSRGAFVDALKELVRKTAEADVFNHQRAAFGNGTGALGTIQSVVDNGGGQYTLVITTGTWKSANWEEEMLVNIQSGNTDLFAISSVIESTRTVVVQRQAGGTKVPAVNDVVFMQGSENNDILGLEGVCLATSGTLYGVNVQRRWRSYQILSYGVAIDHKLFNKLCLGVEKSTGKTPKLAITSYLLYEAVLNTMESQKRYAQPSSNTGNYSFRGVEIMTSSGPIELFPDRFCRDDMVYVLNPDYIAYYRRPNSGWVNEDVKNPYGMLRVVDDDQFELRHATYGQLFIAPTFQGVATGVLA